MALRHLLMLTPAPVLAASTRFRAHQFRPALREAGIETTLSPFLDEEGSALLYRRGGARDKTRAALRACQRRVWDLVLATRADAVFIHREAALVGPPLIEWAMARLFDRPVIFDLDDPIWVPYESPTYGRFLSRALKMPSKTQFTLRAARQVIAGNPYVERYCRQFNDRVAVIPTVVDTEVFRPRPVSNAVPVLGWIGTHSTLPYLAALVPALQRLARQHRFVLRVVGGELTGTEGLSVENRPWSLEREVADFQSLDIGLYPIRPDAWSIGKSGFKAVQYMACGVPVVASPVGVTTEMIRDGDNGFLVEGDDLWVERLGALITDAALRGRMGEAARADAEDRWSLRVHAPRFVSAVSGAMTTSS